MRKLINVLIVVLLFGCSEKNKQNIQNDLPATTLSGNAYGSTYSIVYYSDNSELEKGIADILIAFDNSVNTYKPNSILSSFNKSNHGVEADSILLDLVKVSIQLNEKTDGYFDPSVQPLSKLWGFSSTNAEHLPSQSQIDSILSFTGFQNIALESNYLRKKDPRFELSFNSITGYVNDLIAHYLDEHHVENYLIEIGGEVYAKGKKPNGDLWKIGIDEPTDQEREIKVIVSLQDEGLATSGNYRKYHIDAGTGTKVVHTINPKNGKSESSNLLSATVIATSTAEADAFATALMAMGLEKAEQFIEKNKNIRFYLIWAIEDGGFNSKAYNGFDYEDVE